LCIVCHFVGFGSGLSDPNIGALLKWSRNVFSGSEYRQFRLARTSEVAELQRQHSAEERLFVLDYGDSYDDLAPYIARLKPAAERASQGVAEVATAHVANRPVASIDPSIGAPFELVTVKVRGLNSDRDFSVVWDPGGVASLLTVGRTVQSDGTGECRVFIPRGGIASPGYHAMKIVDSIGNNAVTPFEIATAWPAPWLRAVPETVKPSEELTVVGGGAPKDCELEIFLWTGDTGSGIAHTKTDQRGEFLGKFDLPWTVQALKLVEPGRHRLTVAPREGGAPFETTTYIDIPVFSPPGVLEWSSGSSHKSFDLAIIRPHFRVVDDRISVSTEIRNDRGSPVVFVPAGETIIIEFAMDLTERGYRFERIATTTAARIDPEAKIGVQMEFRRLFDVLPRDVFPIPLRILILKLPFLTAEGELILVQATETFPVEIWSE
jgi:hypothetical protein